MELTYNGSLFCGLFFVAVNSSYWTVSSGGQTRWRRRNFPPLGTETDFPVVYPGATSQQPITEPVSCSPCIQ